MVGILPTVLVRIYRFIVFGWCLSFLAFLSINFSIKSNIQLYCTTCIISSLFELNQYLMYFAHYDTRHLFLFFFFNSWHFFRFFFSQVPGFSDWFNIIYDNDEAIYTYQIRLWFRICRHGNNCLTVWVLQYTLDLIWMLRFNPKKTMF